MMQKRTYNKKKTKTARPSSYRKASGGKKRTKSRSRAKKKDLRIIIACLAALLILFLIGEAALRFAQNRDARQKEQLVSTEGSLPDGPVLWAKQGAPYIDVELLTPNEYSRPQIAIESVQYIAIHYTANPGATAAANRNYFENLAATHETKVSSHFVVGLEGEVIQCIPTSEMSYATNSRNVDTVSIECCHPDESGKFNDTTYESAVKLTAWLCTRFGLTEANVIRHYDVTGKNCPKYYVENPEAWMQMKEDIALQMQEDYVLQENLNAN